MTIEEKDSVLDAGFGIGRHVVLFASEGFSTFGFEPTKSGFSYCQNWLKEKSLKAQITQNSISNFKSENTFDFILCWNVVYHNTLKDVNDQISHLHNRLKPDGLLYLTLNSTKNKWYGKGMEVEKDTFLNPEKDDGDHKHHYSDQSEIDDISKLYNTLKIEEKEQSIAGRLFEDSFHWMITIRK